MKAGVGDVTQAMDAWVDGCCSELSQRCFLRHYIGECDGGGRQLALGLKFSKSAKAATTSNRIKTGSARRFPAFLGARPGLKRTMNIHRV
jgi:hypothetical protein